MVLADVSVVVLVIWGKTVVIAEAGQAYGVVYAALILTSKSSLTFFSSFIPLINLNTLLSYLLILSLALSRLSFSANLLSLFITISPKAKNYTSRSLILIVSLLYIITSFSSLSIRFLYSLSIAYLAFLTVLSRQLLIVIIIYFPPQPPGFQDEGALQ